MIKLLSITVLTGTLLAITPMSLLADSSSCSTWQNNPNSVSQSSLVSTAPADIQACMNSCKNIPLSSSNTGLTPGLCMQNVSYIQYLANTAKGSSTLTTLSSSSSLPSNTPPSQSVSHTQSLQTNSAVEKKQPPSTTEQPKLTSHIINWI